MNYAPVRRPKLSPYDQSYGKDLYMSDISDSDGESRVINISNRRKGRHCRRIIFDNVVDERTYRQVIDFTPKDCYESQEGMFSPYTTTHDSIRLVPMPERHSREARVDPGAIPQVKVQPEIRVPATKSVRESTTQFAQKGSLSQVWDLARATGIANAVSIRFLILLYEHFGDSQYEKLKTRADLPSIINESVMPQLKKLFFFCIIQASPSPVVFICNQTTLRRLWSTDQPMPHSSLSNCWVTHSASGTQFTIFTDAFVWEEKWIGSGFTSDKNNYIIIKEYEELSEKINSAESWKTYRRWRQRIKR